MGSLDDPFKPMAFFSNYQPSCQGATKYVCNLMSKVAIAKRKGWSVEQFI